MSVASVALKFWSATLVYLKMRFSCSTVCTTEGINDYKVPDLQYHKI